MSEQMIPSTEKIDKIVTLIKQAYDLYNELTDDEQQEAEHRMDMIQKPEKEE